MGAYRQDTVGRVKIGNGYIAKHPLFVLTGFVLGFICGGIITNGIIGGIVGGIVSAVIIGLWSWLWTSPHRTYSLQFLNEEIPDTDFPPANANSRQWTTKALIKTQDAVLRMRVKAHEGVSVHELDVRPTQRRRRFRNPLRLWHWQNPPTDTIEVTEKMTDAYASRLSVFGEPTPSPRSDQSSGCRLIYPNNPKVLAAGDSLWLEVPIRVGVSCWKGHLEFMAPSSSGKRAYKRRRIEVNLVLPTPHTVESQL